MNRSLLVVVAFLSLTVIVLACLFMTGPDPRSKSASSPLTDTDPTAPAPVADARPAPAQSQRTFLETTPAAVEAATHVQVAAAVAEPVSVAAAPARAESEPAIAAAEPAAQAQEQILVDERLLSRPLPTAIADLPTVPDPLRGATLIEERREQLADGRIRRLARYTSHLERAPIIRIEELIASIDGDEHILYRQIADAGCLLVDAVPRPAHHDLRAAIENLGYEVVKANLHGEVILVAIDADDLDALPRELARLGKTLPGAWRFQAEEIHWLLDITDDERWGELWGMAKIEAPTVWDSFRGDQDVVVGILDTGIQVDHPDLVDNIWVNELEIPGNGIDDDGNGYIDDINGFDFGEDDNNPNDAHGHGTHVAGTVGARGNNSLGVTGVTQHVRLVACKITYNDGGSAFISDMNEAKRYLRDLRVRGVYIPAYNVSFSTGANLVDKEAFDLGILPVWAAGNSNKEWDNKSTYHATTPYALYVAASTPDDDKASFSNYGKTAIDVAAPGTDILSTIPKNEYEFFQGTSMASPMACGVATLVGTVNRSLSAAQIESILKTTVDLNSAWTNRLISGGRVNAAKAVAKARTYPDIRLLSAPDGAELAKDQTMMLRASVNITTNSVTAVRFFANGSLLGVDNDGSNGWSLAWTPSALGKVDLTAEADDNAGRTTKTWWRNRVTVVNTPSVVPVAQLQVIQISAGEKGDSPQLAVQLSAPAPSALQIGLSLSGSATQGSDYATLPSFLTIPAGGFHALLPIEILDDDLVEGDETLLVSLTSGAGYSLGAKTSVSLLIADDDLSSVSISVVDGDAGEPSNHGSFRLQAVPAPAEDLRIRIALTGTATEGSDYAHLPTFIIMSAGSSAVTVPITVIDDSLNEPTETVILTVVDGPGYRTEGANSASLSITSDDTEPVAHAGEDQMHPLGNNATVTVTLDGSRSYDRDGSIISYSWRQSDNEIATGVNPKIDLTPGAHTIVLRVTDNLNATDEDEVVILILPPASAPYIEDFNLADGTQVDTGSSAWYVDLSNTSDPKVEVDKGVLRCEDTDGMAIWYSQFIDISGGIATLSLDAKSEGNLEENGTDYITCAYIIDDRSPHFFLGLFGNVNGDNWKTYSVDGLSGKVLQVLIRIKNTEIGEVYKLDNIRVTIAGGNQPPVADAGNDLSVTDDDNNGTESISLDGSGSSDPDGSIVSYSWRLGGTEIATGVTPTIELPLGVSVITLLVTDNDGATDEDTVTITVTPSFGSEPKFAAGVITGLGSTWQSVDLPHSYTNAVIIATPAYGAGDLPAVTRIRNLASSSFEIRVQNPSNSSLSGYTVHWLAAEAGVYTNASAGIAMEVRRVTSTVTDTSSSWQAESLGLLQSYLQPVVLGQVLTANDSNWSVFWARSEGSRTNPPAAGSLRVGKHIGGDSGSRADETLGVIIIEAGRYTLGEAVVQCGLGSDSVFGFDDAPPYIYSLSGALGAKTAVLSAAAMDGGDGGWPIFYGPNPISTSQLRLAFDEDQVDDSERSHTDEQVAWLLVESDGQGNTAPVITAGPNATPNPVSGTAALLSVNATDADGDPLTYLWSVTGPATVVMNPSAQNPTVTFQQTGSYTFTITVSDGQGGEVSDAVTVTVGQTPSELNLD